MTEKNKDLLGIVAGTVSQARLLRIPALEEQLLDFERQLQQVFLLDDRSQIADEEIAKRLRELDAKVRSVLKEAKAEWKEKNRKRSTWRLTVL